MSQTCKMKCAAAVRLGSAWMLVLACQDVACLSRCIAAQVFLILFQVGCAAAVRLGSARMVVLACQDGACLSRCIAAQAFFKLSQVGFKAVDTIAAQHGVRLDKLQHNAAVARCSIGGQRVLLAKPMTFMNNSGEAVGRLAKYYKVTVLTTLL